MLGAAILYIAAGLFFNISALHASVSAGFEFPSGKELLIGTVLHTVLWPYSVWRAIHECE